MRRLIITTTLLVFALGASAHAQETTISATLTPNTPGKGSRLHAEVTGGVADLAGGLPESVSLGLQRGFVLDPRAVRVRCAGAALTTGACPAASRIGSGNVLVHTRGFVNVDVPATLDAFLANRLVAGDVASAVLVVRVAGQARAVRARLLAPATGAIGAELRIEGLAGAVPAFPGLTYELRSLVLDVGARRTVTKTVIKRVRVTRDGKRVTVRRKVRRKVTYNLLRNPRTCTTAWGVRLTMRLAGSDRVKDIGIPCAPA